MCVIIDEGNAKNVEILKFDQVKANETDIVRFKQSEMIYGLGNFAKPIVCSSHNPLLQLSKYPIKLHSNQAEKHNAHQHPVKFKEMRKQKARITIVVLYKQQVRRGVLDLVYAE